MYPNPTVSRYSYNIFIWGMDVGSSLPKQNGHHFTDDIFRYIVVNEKIYILIEISLKFVPTGPIYNNPALV